MSISYCCILEKNNHILISESTKFSSFSKEVKALMTRINLGLLKNSFFIEKDLRLIYLRKKTIYFIIIVSVKMNDYKISKFMSKFIDSVESDIMKLFRQNNNLFDLCIQKEISFKLNKQISEFELELFMEKDIFQLENNGIKIDFKNNFREDFLDYLVKSKTIIAKSTTLKNNRQIKRSFSKSWPIYLFLILFVFIAVYFFLAFWKCGNLSILCETS